MMGDIVVAAKMDRMFRSAVDALNVISDFKLRHISLWLLDLDNDCSGNGISELIVTILAATAQFERSLVAERVHDAKRSLRRQGLRRGGSKPFGFVFGPPADRGKARQLVPDEREQAAIQEALKLRREGWSLMKVRDHLRSQGFSVSHQLA